MDRDVGVGGAGDPQYLVASLLLHVPCKKGERVVYRSVDLGYGLDTVRSQQ